MILLERLNFSNSFIFIILLSFKDRIYWVYAEYSE